MSLEQVKDLIQQKKIDQALQKIEQLQNKEKLAGQIYKSIILIQKKELNLALSLVDEIISDSNLKINFIQEFGARIARTQALSGLSRFSEAFEEISRCDHLLGQMAESERQEVKDWEGKLLSIKAGFQATKGDLKKATDTYLQSLALYEEIGYTQEVFNQLSALGWIERVQGKLDEALIYFQKQLKISEEIGNRKLISWSKHTIGNIYFYKGDLKRAAEYAKESMAVYNELKHEVGLSWTYYLLGAIYSGKGEFKKAKEYHQQIFAIYEKNLEKSETVHHCYCMAWRYTGRNYYHKNKLQKSIECYKKALKAHKSFCNQRKTLIDFEIPLYHYYIILSSVEINDNSQIDKSRKAISQITSRWTWLDVFDKAAEAIVLKNRPRAKDKIQAQQLFKEISNERFDYQFEFDVQVNLCELLLDELKFYGEEEVLQEIEGLLARISDIATKQRSITTLVILYSLQAKLALIEGNAELSSGLLSRALTIAENKGLELLSAKLIAQRNLLSSQLEEWKALFVHNSSLQEKLELLNLKEYITEAVSGILEKKFEPKKRFELVYSDLLKEHPRIQKRRCRVAVAQIGVSKTGDILSEFYEEKASGFFGLQREKVEIVRAKVKDMIETASSKGVNILLFPELTIDLNYDQLLEDISGLAKKFEMYIIPGSYHDQKTNQNLSIVISADGILWRQEKHIPAVIHFAGKQLREGIDVGSLPRKTIICNTEYGRIAIVICRDFLDLDLRVELKNFEPPIDLIFNPAFTPVTADFQAAHFDARRSIYAYCFFVNVAEFGNSLIYTPEKERVERNIPTGEENLIYKDVDFFKLRSERKKWEIEQKKARSFIQSTR
ncbi:MAG: tetratricopeptide repeat protein [Candidatus Hodarchaeales archaeon]|jgi:predicted amidohydrolase